MEPQTVTLHLPDATYQRLVKLATKSERPLAEETAYLLNLALATDAELWNAATSTASGEDNELMQYLLEKRQ